MRFAAVGSALIALWQASGEGIAWSSLSNAPEPLWMVLWGVGLLGFAAVAREDTRRRKARKDQTQTTAAWAGDPSAHKAAIGITCSRGAAH